MKKIPVIWVEDAEKSRVSQWNDVTTTSGLVSLDFPLSREPNLGKWFIKMRVGEETHEREFQVIQYGMKETFSSGFVCLGKQVDEEPFVLLGSGPEGTDDLRFHT